MQLIMQLQVLRGLYKPISSNYSIELHQLIHVLLTRDPSQRPTAQQVPDLLG